MHSNTCKKGAHELVTSFLERRLERHPEIAAMAQLDGTQRFNENPQISTIPTIEQLLQGEDWSWSESNSPTSGKDHHEEGHAHPNKRSVLARVREKARKWRQSRGKKKQSYEGATMPSCDVSLGAEDEENEQDAEYFGAPMYESELAPEGYKEAARLHPRTVPVTSEKHDLDSSGTRDDAEQGKETKTITETVTEKLAPAYATVAEATHTIASKIQSLTVKSPTASSTPEQSSGSEQKWDKGVSVKEYLMHKLEPGEDERALSQVISEAISPRKAPGEMGMVEKVKGAVTSLLQAESPSQSTMAISNSSSQIPISTNAHEAVDEENHGRILQTN
ncbi:uncharacterized protein LOC131147631 isoform X2 [Malania oleifera]|uniref:uncharacterized protein LOC131147631 isoform X2 n=1 Tax=Malania oleifera TaxID=397392 RepID=UPI0025ADDF18|nr:uncharacterized protein LOC131147631 isoform X2 [Malania oleifera]